MGNQQDREMMSNLENEIVGGGNSLSADGLDMPFGSFINMYSNDELVIEPVSTLVPAGSTSPLIRLFASTHHSVHRRRVEAEVPGNHRHRMLP